MKTPILAAFLIGLTTTAIYVYPTVDAKPTPQQNPTPKPSVITPVNTQITSQKKIEVVFVLDTTGSMSGLIQGAKDNIWSIASSMASAQSAPIIKMGLVAYRDRGDDYVTKVVDLNEDLDTNYGTLMGFQAAGGGDHAESVNKGLYDAVNSMSWSADEDTYKVIFLVGDAPPQTRYQDEMQFPEIVKLAQDKGIIINTILCGNDGATRSPWKQIASLGQGDFFQVEQSGGAVAVTSPFDDQIATLSRELDGTRLFYGDKKVKELKRKKQSATDTFNNRASSSSIARKAEFNVSKSGLHNFEGENELVGDVIGGRVDLASIQEDELPEELQKLERTEQTRVIQQKAKKREQLKQEIAALSQKRSSHIKAQLAKSGDDKNSIDNKIYQTVRVQAGAKGMIYSSDAPKY